MQYILALTIISYTSFMTADAGATIYFVSENGNDANDGLTTQTAFLHLQVAADLTEPGDSVMALDGVFSAAAHPATGYVLLISRSGTAEKPIIYEAYPGAHPIIESTANTEVYNTVQITGSNIEFTGFEVVGHAQYVTLERATVTAQKEEQLYLTSVKAHQSNPTVSISYPSDALTNGGCIVVSDTDHVRVSSNLVHDCSSTGIGAERSDYIQLVSNIVFNTSWWTVYDTTGINIHEAMNADTNSSYKILIINNISHDSGNTQPYYDYSLGNGIPTDGNGIIIDSNEITPDGRPYNGRTLVMGNISYNNGGSGMHTYKSNHVDFFNNTAFHNNKCPIAGSNCGAINNGQIFANVSGDVNIYNNVMFGLAAHYLYESFENSAVSEDYNLFYSDDGNVPTKVKFGKHDVQLDPKFHDLDLILSSSATPSADGAARRQPQSATIALGLSLLSPARNRGTEDLDDGDGIDPIAMNGNQDRGIDLGALSFSRRGPFWRILGKQHRERDSGSR